uniref:polysaccharide biosynthesis protein n=1 Tax=Yoonia sp. TaxID=2212373 RepID=UPI00404774DF
MYLFVSTLSRSAKRSILLAVDLVLIPVALVAALLLQQGALSPLERLTQNWQILPLLMGIGALLAAVMGTHKIQLKAYETRAIGLTAAHAVSLGLVAAVLDDMAGYGTAFATFVNFALVYFLMSVAARVVMLHLLLAIYRSGADQSRVLIYGAGRTGRQLAAALRTDETILPVAFIDDNTSVQTTIVQGLTVYGPMMIETLVRERAVDRVLLAMPSMPRAKLVQFSRRFEDMGLSVQALPSFAQLTGQEALIDQLEPVVPAKLLGRAPLDAELPGGSEVYAGKTILITGAGGSIGSELCRQLLACQPKKMVLFDLSELALYTIDMELQALARTTNIVFSPVLGSITDAGLMARVMKREGVEIVLHAAAYKHVPLVERNAVVGLSNNVLGTQTLAMAAADAGVERFILISSDKAVRPTNMMGASKRLAEMVIQDLANRETG